MPDDGSVFSADPDQVKLGGLNLEHVSDVATSIYGNLRIYIEKYPDLSGDGGDDISKALLKTYKGGANGCLSFISDLADLLKTHGNTTSNLGDLFNDVNTTATDQAGGVPGHRR